MFRALFITIAGASIFSCLTVPLLFDLLGNIAGSTPWPFSRVFDRVFLFYLLVFILYYRHCFNTASIREALSRPPRWVDRTQQILLGLGISAGCVSICMLGVFAGGALVPNERTTVDILLRLAVVLPGALLIAVIEELFFRVLLLERLRDYVKLPFAVLLSSLFYALVHFITPEKNFVYHGSSWLEGFHYVPALLERMVQPGTEIGVAGLFVVGIILGFAIVRTGSLYLVIGLHAGWICSLKMISYLSLRTETLPVPQGLGGRYSLFGEEWTWFSFMLVFVIIAVLAWGKQMRGWFSRV